MTAVAVPLWLLVMLAVLAALQWLLLPGWRWIVRRKVRRVLDEIQLRLNRAAAIQADAGVHDRPA